MKKIFFYTSLMVFVNFPFFSIAQTIQTKTEKINNETVRTYSFYINEQGEPVRHGKYTITWNVNKNDYKVNRKLECNYKNGVLHGKLTYSNDWNVYKAYYTPLEKNLVNWELVLKQLDNFTVDMYNGYMTGDINVTYQGYWTEENNFRAKAINGVLADNSELVVSIRPREVIKGKLTYLSDATEAKRYKNILPTNTPNPNLQDPGEFISFEFPSDQYGGMEKYVINLPRFVDKPYDELKNIPEYKFLITYEGLDLGKISGIEHYIRESYYLSEASKDTLHEHYILATQKVEEREKAERKAKYLRENAYRNAYNKANALVESFNTFNKKMYLKSIQNYYTSDGYVHPVVIDVNVENLLYKGYSMRISSLRDIINSYNLSDYGYYGKIKENNTSLGSKNTTYEEITDETVKTMIELAQNLNDENILNSIKSLTMLCEIENEIIEKMFDISTYYTKSTYSEGEINAASSKIPRFTNENCTIKCTTSKNLYNAYTEVSGYMYQQLSNSTLPEHLDIMKQFSKIVDVMHQGINTKTKELEKALKETTTVEDKLKIFLQN